MSDEIEKWPPRRAQQLYGRIYSAETWEDACAVLEGVLAALDAANAKLACIRSAWQAYQNNQLDREEFEGVIAEIAEDP